MRLSVAIVFAILVTSSAVAETSKCPSQPGIYALKAANWVELPTARLKKTKDITDSVFLAHSHITDVFLGQASALTLSGNTLFCVSNAPLGATFIFAKARVKKDTREVGVGKWVPWSGSFYFGIDKSQEVSIEQKRDESGAIILKCQSLGSGQYILFLQQGTTLRSTPTAFDFGIQ